MIYGIETPKAAPTKATDVTDSGQSERLERNMSKRFSNQDGAQCDGAVRSMKCSAFRDDNSVELFRWQGMLWSRCVTRKRMRDHDGGDDIPAGSVVWRPLTNGKHRMNRLEYVPRTAEVVARTLNWLNDGTQRPG